MPMPPLIWLREVRKIQDLTVGIVASDGPPSPELLVVIDGSFEGFTIAARCDRFTPGALARMEERAEFAADLLELLACSWVPGDPFAADAPPRPG